MADITVIIDSFPVDGSKQLEKKSLKRKRTSLIPENVSIEERESRIDGLRRELDSLFQYFKQVFDQKVHLEENGSCSSGNFVIACFLEESSLPFSKLVEEIYEKLNTREGITLASVRSTVLLVGQRSMYGIANADADVLEDDTEKCLWCWETRDLKLIPKMQRGVLNIRRTCRKKIHERITAVSAMIAALQMPESHPNYKNDLMKASEKIVKALNEADIRRLVENMVHKNGADLAEKEAKLKEKELIKELERSKREIEKEKKRMDRELQKEKLQNEKELKRLQDEAEKEEKRREKEEAEMKKHLKRQQEEAEKDHRRREKEEAELKKQLSIQKQATIMERFLKTKKNDSGAQDRSCTIAMISDSSRERDEDMLSAATLSMDCALSLKDGLDTGDLRRSQLDAWHKLGLSIRSYGSKHWGMRHKPKTLLIKELKLQGSSSWKVTPTNKGLVRGDELSMEKHVEVWEEAVSDYRSGDNSADRSLTDIRICNRTRKLLQFDKSYRPAYYGTLSKKSDVIGPRHPFKKDPNLDYDLESDGEWEEEDPGESLSDCDKDNDEENLEEGNLRTEDEDGSEDGFLVPDGYLSESEGVQVDSMETDPVDGNARSLPGCKQDLESEEFRALLRQQKYIYNLTEHALQKNQPLIISNLMHEKATLLMAEDLNGTLKIEQMCLQALSIRPISGGPHIEISTDHRTLDEDQEVCQSQSKGSTPAAAVTAILDKDLPKIVGCIQSCSLGINKVVESLQRRFPAVPKSHLRNKVREISEFVDNRWQVKKEILDKLGLSSSPEKGGGRTKGIATFFSKRCLPPAGKTINVDETSPEQCRKPEIRNSEHGCTDNPL